MFIRKFRPQVERDMYTDSLNSLEGTTVGIDVVRWLRTLTHMKDPYANLLGGISPIFLHQLEESVQILKEAKIDSIFVLAGMHPTLEVGLHNPLNNSVLQNACKLARNGPKRDAIAFLMNTTSRVNDDFLHLAFHCLQALGCKVMRAPYGVDAQLAHLLETGCVDYIFGTVALMLYGTKRFISGIDWEKKHIIWADLDNYLKKWEITHSQLIEVCILLGTSYSDPVPYMNLEAVEVVDIAGQNGVTTQCATEDSLMKGRGSFDLENAIKVIKKCNRSPLLEYSEQLSSNELFEYMKQQFLVKILLDYTPILNTKTRTVTSLRGSINQNVSISNSKNNQNVSKEYNDSKYKAVDHEKKKKATDGVLSLEVNACNQNQNNSPMTNINCPSDLHQLIGTPLPRPIYDLLCKGLLSPRVCLAIASHRWVDIEEPIYDTIEYRRLALDLRDEYSSKTLGILSTILPTRFFEGPFPCYMYWMHHAQYRENRSPENTPLHHSISPVNPLDFFWKLTDTDIVKELVRQRRDVNDQIDFGFCLKFHMDQTKKGGPLFLALLTEKKYTTHELSNKDKDKEFTPRLFSALIHFQILESLNYFSPQGKATLLGVCLRDCPPYLQEFLVHALELWQLGYLNTKIFTSQEGITDPELEYEETFDPLIALVLRVVSLVPVHKTDKTWSGDADFDLAIFHSLVKSSKSSLRDVTESIVSKTLIKNPNFLKHLPNSLMDPRSSMDGFRKDGNLNYSLPLVPTFVIPTCCLGILLKTLLSEDIGKLISDNRQSNTSGISEIHQSSEAREAITKKHSRLFACFTHPFSAIKIGLLFWDLLKDIICKLLENTMEEELREFMEADILVKKKLKPYGF